MTCPWRWLVVAPLLVATALGVSSLAQTRLDGARLAKPEEQLLYLPNDKLLTHFTGGMNSVIADLLWLRCIQYTSEHFRGDHKFTWLEQMTNVVTRMDPYYVDVYRYGGIFLASLKSDDDASIKLMERGFAQNPDAWELPYEMAMVYLLNRHDQPGSAEAATHYLGLAIATDRAPQSVLEIAQGLQRKHNLVDVERRLWLDLKHNSTDRFMQDLAERKLQEMTVRQNVAALQLMADGEKSRTGRALSKLDELVANGVIDRIPDDPLGGSYILNADGQVQSTALLDDAVERRRDILRKQIASFRRQVGRLPATLEEMVEMKVVPSIPKHPYKERAWTYDAATGDVS